MACCGLKPSPLSDEIKELGSGLEMARDFISRMQEKLQSIGELDHEDSINAMKWAQDIVEHAEKHPAAKMIEAIDTLGYKEANFSFLDNHPPSTTREQFTFFGLEDLELSTQILLREAVFRGVKFSFLDRGQNFITLHKTGKTEHIMQATRTSLDPYNSVLIMENKSVTKKILSEAGIRVPQGDEFSAEKGALQTHWEYVQQAIVVKPKQTKFWIGHNHSR
jgi:glutamate--cysteine ligase